MHKKIIYLEAWFIKNHNVKNYNMYTSTEEEDCEMDIEILNEACVFIYINTSMLYFFFRSFFDFVSVLF